jgi:hypothetical protein
VVMYKMQREGIATEIKWSLGVCEVGGQSEFVFLWSLRLKVAVRRSEVGAVIWQKNTSSSLHE